LAESASPGGVGYALVLTSMLARTSLQPKPQLAPAFELFPKHPIATGAWRPM
jgi:hypothetical protein